MSRTDYLRVGSVKYERVQKVCEAMFPFFSRENSVLVQPLYQNGNSLAFACEELLEAEDLKIRDRSGQQAQVQVQQRRRADDRSWIYFAQLLEGAVEPEWPAPGYQLRQSPRFTVGVRTRSPQLPEFSAMTEDLSSEGAQLNTAGPLKVGDEIELYLDLDGGFPAVRTIARVCWSKLTAPWRAGVSFVDLDHEGQRSIVGFLAQRYGQTVLPGLTADTPRAAFEPAVLEKMALLQSSFDDGDALVLKLLTHDEVMEIRFRNAQVLQSNLQSQLVARIVSQTTPEGTTRTWLIDPEGVTLVEIDAGPPEILCRGLRTHDLG